MTKNKKCVKCGKMTTENDDTLCGDWADSYHRFDAVPSQVDTRKPEEVLDSILVNAGVIPKFEDTQPDWEKAFVYYSKFTSTDSQIKFIHSTLQSALKKQREELVEFIANYQIDLCENSQKFKDDILEVLKDNNE